MEMAAKQKQAPKTDTPQETKMGRIVSFQPAPDIREVLVAAKAAGLDISSIINESLRANGSTIARRAAEDLQKRLESFKKSVG